MLLNNTSDKEWNVARQKAKATIGEAFRLMTVNGEIDPKLTTTQMAENILPKYLKIAKKCGLSSTTKNLTDCGFSVTIKRPNGDETAMPSTWQTIGNPKIWKENPPTERTWADLENYNSTNHNTGYALQTLDGFSLNFFYNPYCAYDFNDKVPWYDNDIKIQMAMDVVCFNAIYDMNGSKGPNRVGKDIGFVGSFYNNYNTKAEAVLPHDKEVSVSTLSSGADRWLAAMNYCRGLDENDTWILPNIDELSLLHINLNLVRNGSVSRWFFSRSLLIGTADFYGLEFNSPRGGNRARASRTGIAEVNSVRCVRNNALK